MEQEFQTQQPPPTPNPPKKDKENTNLIGGIILITIGVIFLFDRFIPGVNFGDLWPIILVVIGVIMVRKAYQKSNNHSS
jgi:uncharacterized membrane protein HdeD (DUF308 family)